MFVYGFSRNLINLIEYFLDCFTIGGPDPNVTCVKMWKYAKNGKTYKGCAKDDDGTAWCPTEVNEQGIFTKKISFYIIGEMGKLPS